MKTVYKFTQNDFPFPYNKSDVWQDNVSIGEAFTYKQAVSIDLGKMVYEEAVRYILEKDNGAILNALKTTEHHLSQDQINDILAWHKLTKDDYMKKTKERFKKNV